jgi:hypothetical protein
MIPRDGEDGRVIALYTISGELNVYVHILDMEGDGKYFYFLWLACSERYNNVKGNISLKSYYKWKEKNKRWLFNIM